MDNIFTKKADSEILNITRFRLIFHKYLYNNAMYVNELNDIISNNIETLSIDSNMSNLSITIKIKKTSMRKRNPRFVHDVRYYYTIFNEILGTFINNHINEIINILNDENINVEQFFADKENLISGIYNITCVSDNIIILYL